MRDQYPAYMRDQLPAGPASSPVHNWSVMAYPADTILDPPLWEGVPRKGGRGGGREGVGVIPLTMSY